MTHDNTSKGFIKVCRSTLDWEWYTDINTKVLFLHCLLKANWKAGVWHGIPYKAGEFITSLGSLAKETGLTMRQARTALSHLESTGEVTSTLTNRATGKKLTRCRIITINNWGIYQGSDKQNDKRTTSKASSKRQASDKQNDKQTTTDKEVKKIPSVSKEKKNTPAADPPSEDDELFDDVWEDADEAQRKDKNGTL